LGQGFSRGQRAQKVNGSGSLDFILLLSTPRFSHD
jgi:hypothetical protein